MAFARHEEDYTKSNSIEKVNFAHLDTNLYSNLLAAGDSSALRQMAGQTLLNHLCIAYNIPKVPLKVVDTPRPRKERGMGHSELHGFYKYSGLIPLCIEVYNTTAVKHQVVSIKQFAGTLLHEFIHHYDTHVLRLGKSLHTAGFYKRITSLENLLSGK